MELAMRFFAFSEKLVDCALKTNGGYTKWNS